LAEFLFKWFYQRITVYPRLSVVNPVFFNSLHKKGFDMPAGTSLIALKRSLLHKSQRMVMILGIACALTGCSINTVTAGAGGIPIEGGGWTGRSADGRYTIQFTIGVDGANIFVYSYSFPCGKQNESVFPPNAIKITLNQSAFITTTKKSDLMPSLVIAGQFTDRTHAQGTWGVFRFVNGDLNLFCPASAGAWTGSPD
jgi:hypothetical protein